MSDYKIHKAWVDEAEFEILIIELPNDKNELEDKLAYLARDKGNITKSFYEDFIIVTCIANINQMLFHIKQQSSDTVDLMKIREQIMEKIISVNPALDPSNLIINRNSVIKLKSGDELKEDERNLTDNKAWENSYYEEVLDHFDDDIIDLDYDKINVIKPNENDESKSIDDLNFELDKKWWKRINQYIEIKKFHKKNTKTILSSMYFHNRSSFKTYIVSMCVVDSDDLFIMLDNMGIPNRVSPPVIMNEIYQLCLEVNPFLTYENAQKFCNSNTLSDDDEDELQETKKTNSIKSSYNKNKKKSKKQKKKFKDVSKEELLALSKTMKYYVIGQDEAIDNIVKAIQRASVGLKDPNKPIGSFLFAGRTGCGKTLTTKILADSLIKDRNNLITVDCSEYSADHEYSKLIGSPAGYVGHEQGGMLTNAITENPFSVVVFDEIEKASSKVHELMLQILEEGRLTDGRGQKVSFKDTVIIMTSNVGVTEVDDVKRTVGFGDVAKLTEDKKVKSIDKAIKKKFKPEFINRIDSIVHFNSLTKNDYMKVIDIELYKLNDNLKNNDTEYKNLTLNFDKKIRNLIYKEGIDEDFGARPLKRCIEKKVSDKLAEVLLTNDISPTSDVFVSVKKKEIIFEFKDSEEEKKINSDSLLSIENTVDL